MENTRDKNYVTGIDIPAVQYIDGESVFRLYFVEMGSARSIAKVVKRLAKEGKVNQKTNRKFTRMGVWDAMWRWAVKNPQRSFEIYKEGMKQSDFNSGRFIEYTYETYLNTDLKNKVVTIYKGKDKSVERWLNQHRNDLTTSA